MNNSILASTTMHAPTKVIDGINIYEQADYNQWFEEEYSTTAEPWKYSHRAAELYRHIYSVKKVLQYNTTPKNLLELGCSKGLMTELLIHHSKAISAADISLSALKACKQRCDPKAKESSCHISYFVATTPNLPFDDNTFDVVTICDGLVGWYLPFEQRQLALKDVYRVLQKGGIAILTDCLMPEKNKGEFDEYKVMVQNSPFSVIEISYLYDKPWYMLESFFKKTGLENKLRSTLSNISLAKALNNLGRLFGRKASRHIVVMVRKD